MKTIAAAILAGFVVSSCAPTTPQARIAKSPEKFETLPKKYRDLVEQGQLGQGMPKDAVLLAWGFPDQRYEGSKDSQKTERWDYTGSRPVYSSGFSSGFGYGYYGRFGYPSSGYDVGPEVIYIPERLASVWFVNDRVEAWERVR